MSHTENTAQDRLNWAKEFARKNGLRRTEALDRILHLLADAPKPVTWTQVCEDKEILGKCDPATVFRILSKIEKIGLVRRLGFHARASYFSLNIPGEHHDYLICRDCGSISDLDIHCPVHSIEEEVKSQSGFKELYHELEFYGVCPTCQNSNPALTSA